MKKILYSILTASIAVSCSSGDNLETNNTVQIPSGEKMLTTTPMVTLTTEEARQVTGLFKCGNNLILGHYNAEYAALSIDLQTKSRQNMLPVSRNRKERNGMSGFNVRNNEQLSTFNFRTGQLSEKSVTSGTRSGETSQTIQLPEGQQHLQTVRVGSFIIATGLYEQGRYLLYSPESGIAEYQLPYPTHPAYPNIQEKTKSILYASTVLKVRPDNQAFVCADMYSGNIEFCRIIGERIEQVKTSCFHHPKVYINEKARAKVAYSRDNKFGFTDITVSEDRVYAIYSGRTYREDGQRSQQCRKLMVFDWEGSLLNTYDIDSPLSNISYDETENVLYGLARNSEPTLVKMSL